MEVLRYGASSAIRNGIMFDSYLGLPLKILYEMLVAIMNVQSATHEYNDNKS